LPWNPAAAVVDTLTSHVPDDALSQIDGPRAFFSQVVGNNTRVAMRNVEGRLSGDRYVKAGEQLYDGGYASEAFANHVSAIHGDAGGYLDGPQTARTISHGGSAMKRVDFIPTGEYRTYTKAEPLHLQMWRKNLQEIQSSGVYREAANTIGSDATQRIQDVADYIDSPAFAKIRTMSTRSNFLRDGSQVGADATPRAASVDWAQAVISHVDSVLLDPDGNPIGDLHNQVLAGKIPTTDQLRMIPQPLRPTGVHGPEVLAVPYSRLNSLMTKGMDEMVGRPMDWMVRQPMFVHAMADARDAAEQVMRPLLGNSPMADQTLTDLAVDRALKATVPYIHDPSVRSQFSEITRNLMPFWFAQEQFMKRWAKTFVHSPEAIREAQLTMGGLRHSGFIHKDAQGNDYFVYPATGIVQNLLTNTIGRITGKDITLPLMPTFSGQVRFATPGLERLGLPSFGPFVAMPVSALSRRFPELAGLEQGVLGQRGAGHSFWEQITPTTVQRLVHVITDNPENPGQMHSAYLQAVQYLEAAGQGLPANAGTDQTEQWLSRVKSWSRILMLNRALYGFSAPASPDVQMDPNHLHEDFRNLLDTEPTYGDAVKEFMKLHPDATPYTVFQTKAKGDAPLPATADAFRFMTDNNAFLKKYKTAAGFFIPQKSADPNFSQEAYREQMDMGLRNSRTGMEFFREMKYQEAADAYYKYRDQRDQLLAQAKYDPARKQQINQGWSDWEQQYLADHPIFRDIKDSGVNQVTRMDTIDELHQALADPAVPSSPQVDLLRNMVNVYDDLQVRLGALKGQTSSYAAQQRKDLKTVYETWAKQYVNDYPEVRGLFERVYAPTLGFSTQVAA
jgi:hypothetical protein